MKRRIVLTALALGAATWLAAATAGASERKPVEAARVVAYYFHSTERCVTCRRIESDAEQALRVAFAEELKRGSLEWRVVNIDQEPNRHFVEDFALYTSSLVLVSQEAGKPRWKNLEKVWQLVGKPEAFQEYIEDEVRRFVKGS